MPNPISIHVKNSHLVLRGYTGDRLSDAVLSGNAYLTLDESTSVKSITATFSGSARLELRDSAGGKVDHKFHVQEETLLGDFGGSKAHTIGAGTHKFPLRIQVPGTLPPTIRLSHGRNEISYKLKVTVHRPGLMQSSHWKSAIPIHVHRSLAPGSNEFISSMEIENTWPQKLMYSFSIPHKAWAAGDVLSVSVKLVHLAKRTRVVAVKSVLREIRTVHLRGGQSTSQKIRYNGVEHLGKDGVFYVKGGASGGDSDTRIETVDDLDEVPTEIDEAIHVPIPRETVVTSNVEPIVVYHNFDWSVYIKNPDGHLSEVKCSLPITVLSAELHEEVVAASRGNEDLQFDASGVYSSSSLPPAQLPAYEDYIHDRRPTADVAYLTSGVSTASTPGHSDDFSFAPAPWSANATPLATPAHTRPSSPSNDPFDFYDVEYLRTLGLDTDMPKDNDSRPASHQGSSQNGSRPGSSGGPPASQSQSRPSSPSPPISRTSSRSSMRSLRNDFSMALPKMKRSSSKSSFLGKLTPMTQSNPKPRPFGSTFTPLHSEENMDYFNSRPHDYDWSGQSSGGGQTTGSGLTPGSENGTSSSQASPRINPPQPPGKVNWLSQLPPYALAKTPDPLGVTPIAGPPSYETTIRSRPASSGGPASRPSSSRSVHFEKPSSRQSAGTSSSQGPRPHSSGHV